LNSQESNGNKPPWALSFQKYFLQLLKRASAKLIDRNSRALLRFIVTLGILVTSFSIIFQLLMAYEGQKYSFISGFYWTLSTMSTLGYGDISFVTDLGRLYSILVLLSGIIYMLILLPFTFIELFYEPWMESRAASRVRRTIADEIHDHVILTFYDPVIRALIPKLVQFDYAYILVLPELDDVLRLNDKGINAIHGELNDPDTFIRAGVKRAAMVATTRSDIINTSVVFTARGVTDKTLIIATAREETSTDVLKLAGCNRVLDLTHLIAEALARRAIGGDKLTHIVGRIDDLVIAEVDAARTSLVGQGYNEAQRATSVSIVGFWARGNFEIGQQESVVEPNTVLLLAGSTAQLREFDTNFKCSGEAPVTTSVLIIGGGRVGRATAVSLQRRGIDYVIVEQLEKRARGSDKVIHGSASDRGVLQRAGIDHAPTVIITPRDDETNIYLTILCRLLRPDIQIICRSTFEESVASLHRAGCDIVMSYSSMGSNSLFNLLQRSDLLMIAEGLDVFKTPVPKELAGKTIAEANIRQRTKCSIIGIDNHEGTVTNPSPDTVLPLDGDLVMVGTPSGESEFLKLFQAS
jgi:Trk K+ transport system NAD-binding subunit|tara:strand:- start:541 stop:2280 length:1740 start_codon:yes stop_codon:yes gene_type:complete